MYLPPLPVRFVALIVGIMPCLFPVSAPAGEPPPHARQLIGWGWEQRPHGQTLASDVLGQFADGDPARPHFGSYGPYGGPKQHGFFFYAFNSGRYQTVGGLAAHLGLRRLAIPDYWNHRVLLFELNAEGSLAERRAGGLIGQTRFDTMELGQGPDRLHFPSACAFDPSGRHLFVADEYNHRVLQFDTAASRRAVRVFGQRGFDTWGPDATPGTLVWDSTRAGIRGPALVRNANARGFFLPRGVACDGKRLFVSDCDNHRVLVFDTAASENGPAAVAVLGQADFHSHEPNRGGRRGPQTMLFPGGLALDRTGRFLLVADSMNGRVLVFDLAGGIEDGMPATAVLPLWGTRLDELPKRPERRSITGAVDVTVDEANTVFVSDRRGARILVHRLDDVLRGETDPLVAMGNFELGTDLRQTKPGYVGPTGLAVAGAFLYAAEPRGNRVLCFDTSDPHRRAVDLLGQFHGNDLTRPDYHKYGPNNGPDPYGFDFADGTPALSVTEDGQWLLAADTIGGRLLFFPLGVDGLALDRSARLALGVPTLTARANNYGADRFNRPSHSLLTSDGRLFASDFQGSRILYFELPDFAASQGKRALEAPRPFVPPSGRKPGYREWFEFRSIDSGVPALHVLGQENFETGLRGVASQRQMGKEMSGLAMDRQRGWLFIAEKLNHRVLVVDVSGEVETFMPALHVLGQRDFDHNSPNWGRDDGWHPAGMTEPSGVCYDHTTKTLFVASGANLEDREILGFDLSGDVTNGMEPRIRIGGQHATVKSDLPFVDRTLALDEQRRRLWSGLFALDISGDIHRDVPVIGWFGLGPHPEVGSLQGYNTGGPPNLLGYSVGFCHRFGGGVNATAVNPRTGTLYVAGNARYRVLCFQPSFQFRSGPLRVTAGKPLTALTGTGGLAPLEFLVQRGRLPDGLTMDPRTGLISGIATAAPGEYRVSVRVKTALEEVTGEVRIELAKKP